jgi:riboflavin biosynthesis pyrimidine reductase
VIAPLELLYEPDGLAAFDLPPGIAAVYPGTLGFPNTLGLTEPRVFANFVSTLDGVVAIPSIRNSNKLVAGGSPSDRFVMGILRACADALVIGSGTLSAAPGSLWTPEQAYPDAAADFADLRRALGRTRPPEVVVLSASGLVDTEHPALAAGAIVLTSDEGAARLDGRLPGAATAISLGPGPLLDLTEGMAAVHERGHRLVLSEGGPHVLGSLLDAGLVDELFLTVSPLLVGRVAGDPRLALVEGSDLTAGGLAAARLTGVRRDVDHLFLRYELNPRT